MILLDCIDAGVRKPSVATVLTVANEGLWQTLLVYAALIPTALFGSV